MGKTNNKSTKASSKKGIAAVKSGDRSGMTAQLRILIAIAEQNRLGVEEPERQKIASLAGVKNTGSFNTICGRMKKAGLIEHPGSKVMILTDKGREQVQPHLPPEPKTNKDCHDELKGKISRAKVRQMFDLLTDGDDHRISELAELVEMDETSASFKVYVGCLNPNVEKFKSDDDGTKMIRLKNECFPFGRGNE